MTKPPATTAQFPVVEALRGYSYCTGNALQALFEADEAQAKGREKLCTERLREAVLWLELELQRCERLSDNCVIAEIDSLPTETAERARVLELSSRIPLWSQLLRVDPSQPVRTVGCITKRAAIETVELIKKLIEAGT